MAAIIDEKGMIMKVNRLFESLNRYTREEVVGKRKLTECAASDESSFVGMFGLHCTAVSQKIPSMFELCFIRWDHEISNGLIAMTANPEANRAVIFSPSMIDKIQAEDPRKFANWNVSAGGSNDLIAADIVIDGVGARFEMSAPNGVYRFTSG